MQGSKEVFTKLLQRITSAVNRKIPNSEARQIIVESLAFENANSLCKRISRPLKARSAPLGEWIWNTINIESHEHDNTWIREVIFRGLKKNWNVKCYNCGKQGHFKRDCRQGIPRRKFFFLRIIHSECPSLLDYAEVVAKAGIGLMNVGKQGIFMVLLEGPLTGPYAKLGP